MNQIKTLIMSNEISKANKGLKWDSSDITNKKHRRHPFTVEKLKACNVFNHTPALLTDM